MKLFDYWKLLRKYNTLENDYETLKNAVKDELFDKFMAKLGEPMELARLREENKNLRIKNKKYKEELNNGNSHKERRKRKKERL